MFTFCVFGTTSVPRADDPFKTACVVNVIHLSTLKSADGQRKAQCSAKSMPPKVNQPAVIFTEFQ